MKELKNRTRENKYLTREETDFIIKTLEENPKLHERINMAEDAYKQKVNEYNTLINRLKMAKEEMEYHKDLEHCILLMDKIIAESER
jgi:hypothetical protein